MGKPFDREIGMLDSMLGDYSGKFIPCEDPRRVLSEIISGIQFTRDRMLQIIGEQTVRERKNERSD